MLYKFYGGEVRISVKPRRFIFIKLKYGEYQEKFMLGGRGSLRLAR
jgi:hypothetical protein